MRSLDPSDPAPTTAAARDPADREAGDGPREPAPASAPLVVAPTERVVRSVRPRPRFAPPIAAALIVVMAFGAGIGVGRVTAPAGPVASAATAASGGPSQAASSGGAPSSTAAAGASPAPSQSGTSPLAGLPSDGALLGSATAKVQMTYWADFQCPFCSRFAHDVLPPLAPLIADGTLSVRHRDFVFLGPESVDAAIAVRCGGEQGRYWPMHDAVYAAQQGENTGSFAVARLKEVAAAVGLDASAFAACLVRHGVLVAVLADTSAAVRAGVSSTPTVDLPGQRLVGAMDAAKVLAAIRSAAANGATPTPVPSVSLSGDPWAGTPTSGLTAGADTAAVTVELWTDYQAAGTPDVVKTLERALRTRAASGKVRVVLRDLATMGGESAIAASFVRCAAQDGEQGVWLAHSILGAASRGAGTGLFTNRALLWLGAKLGYDVGALDACMAAPATASAIAADTAAGTALGLRAAPAVVVRVGGKVVARFDGPTIDTPKVLAAVDKTR